MANTKYFLRLPKPTSLFLFTLELRESQRTLCRNSTDIETIGQNSRIGFIRMHRPEITPLRISKRDELPKIPANKASTDIANSAENTPSAIIKPPSAIPDGEKQATRPAAKLTNLLQVIF